jgi:hypothetical protein
MLPGRNTPRQTPAQMAQQQRSISQFNSTACGNETNQGARMRGSAGRCEVETLDSELRGAGRRAARNHRCPACQRGRSGGCMLRDEHRAGVHLRRARKRRRNRNRWIGRPDGAAGTLGTVSTIRRRSAATVRGLVRPLCAGSQRREERPYQQWSHQRASEETAQHGAMLARLAVPSVI